MSHGPEHQIEHAEHAAHAAHDPFDKRVTVSIAVLAAVLAAVTMLGHRAHNETLRLQGEALRVQSEALRVQGDALRFQSMAGIDYSQAFNRWAAYQAQNIRGHMYGALALHLESSAPSASAEVKKTIQAWRDKSKDYEEVKLPKWKKEAESFDAKGNESAKEGDEKLKETQKKMHESEKILVESHAAHAKGERFDIGELGLQLGVVLCSLAILSKQRGFWYAGLGCGAAGALVAVSGILGLFIGGGHH